MKPIEGSGYGNATYAVIEFGYHWIHERVRGGDGDTGIKETDRERERCLTSCGAN